MSAPIFERVQAELGPLGAQATIAHGVLVAPVAAADVLATARALQTLRFDILLDVTAVDWLGQSPRFEIVWHFYSTAHKVRVRVKTRVGEQQPEVDSLISLYGSAAIMERECHEMYGIRFAGHDDLRKILLYEGFAGYPLRKDYAKELEQPLVPYREGVR